MLQCHKLSCKYDVQILIVAAVVDFAIALINGESGAK